MLMMTLYWRSTTLRRVRSKRVSQFSGVDVLPGQLQQSLMSSSRMVFFIPDQLAERGVQCASAKRRFVLLSGSQLVWTACITFDRVQLIVQPAGDFFPRWQGVCLGPTSHSAAAESAAYHYGCAITGATPEGIAYTVDVALVLECHDEDCSVWWPLDLVAL